MSPLSERPAMPATPVRRVAIVEDTPFVGGAEINTLHLASSLDPNRVCLHVFVPQRGPLFDRLSNEGAWVTSLEMPGFHSISFYWRGRKLLNPLSIVADLLLLLFYGLKLWHQLRIHRIEVVHTNGMLAHFGGGTAARLARVACVWHVQDIVNSQHRGRRWLLRTGARWLADRVVVISPAVASQFDSTGGNNLTLLPNGTDLTRFSGEGGNEGSLREFAGDRLLVAHVGRITRWKGQHLFLEAARQLLTVRSDVAFVLVGDASLGDQGYLAELETFVGQHDLSASVLFAGWHAEMPAVYRQIDLLALCSIEPEPFGLVIIEAMASYVPVIATNEGGPAQILQDGESGVLVPPGDARTLATKIAVLADDEKARRKLAKKGRHVVEQRYDLASYARRMEAIYLSL